MIDLNLLRADKGGDVAMVRESQRKRGAKPELIDKLLEMDDDFKKTRYEADIANQQINAIQKQIAAFMKQGKKEDAQPLMAQKDQLTQRRLEINKLADEKEKAFFKLLSTVGNIVHESVPDSLTEDDNAMIRQYWPSGRGEEAERQRRIQLVGGATVKEGAKGVPGLYSHHEILDMVSGFDMQRGVAVAGHRAYFLTGFGVDLNMALIRYGLDFLEQNGYTKIQTPFMMRREMMAKTAQLEQFDEELYKVVEGGKEDDEDTKYLIATAEQPISALHAGEWLEPAQLPKRYAGFSTNFRKEAGAHGKDTWGIYRVHQFEKIEQFVISDPENSWEEFDRMIDISERFYQSLEIPYRIVAIVSGALNNAAAKKYDLEAWFPFQCEYKELVSCSNCTDYQSRSLEIRAGTKKLNDTGKRYVHMLNSTLCATERTMCCIVENYQRDGGIEVPKVLRPYIGKDFIPYPAPVEKVADGVKNLKVK